MLPAPLEGALLFIPFLTVSSRLLTLNRRIREKRQEEEYEAALKDFDTLVYRFGKETGADILNKRGMAYFGLEKYEEALRDYNEAIRLEPGSADFYAIRSLAHIKLNNGDACLADLNQAIKINPRHKAAYIRRGGLFTATGRFQDAVDDYSRAIEIAPRDSDAYGKRAYVYGRLAAEVQDPASKTEYLKKARTDFDMAAKPDSEEF
jgi:tetratricopeptide (TPR) repeat protein